MVHWWLSIDSMQREQEKQILSGSGKSWTKEVVAAIYTHDAKRLTAAYKEPGALIDKTVEAVDSYHWRFGDYLGIYHQSYDESIGGYVSGAYDEKVCPGDTALMIAIKTGDISTISALIKLEPNYGLMNANGDRAATVAKRLGVDERLGPLNADGDLLGQGRFG